MGIAERASTGHLDPAPSLRSFRRRLTIGALVVVAGHAVWILVFRPGFGLGLDEARLLPVAHQFADALSGADVGGLARAWTDHEVTAPLLALVTAPFLTIIDETAVAAALPVAGFGGLLVLASAELALTLADRTAAVLTAIATAVGFGFVLWSRVHEQIVPGAALWVLAIVLLLRSDGLRRPGLRRAAGVALGLALLVRTMLIAFVPVLLVLYAWHCRQRLGRLAGRAWAELIGLCLAVAATWWAFQWRSAVDYLRPRGYGSGSFPFGPERWVFEIAALAGIGGFCLLVAVPVLLGAGRRHRRLSFDDIADPRVLVAAVALAGFVILVTVGEEFAGFQALVAPLVLAVAASVVQPRGRRAFQVPFGLAVVASLAVAALPGASWVAIADTPPETLVVGMPERYREVARLPDEVVTVVVDRLPGDRRAVAAVFDDHHFHNAHLFEAAARRDDGANLWAVDSAAPRAVSDESWSDVALVLVYDVDGCKYEAVDLCELERQLGDAGFTVVDRWDVVDDRELRLWERP